MIPANDAKPLEEMFHGLVKLSIEAHGVYPHHMLVRTDEGVEVYALDLKPAQAFAYFLRATLKAQEVVFGLDRFTLPDQGTTLGDVVTCAHFRREGDQVTLRIGIIEYQHDPRIVKPWDWENSFWNQRMLEELGLAKERMQA